MLAWIQPVVRDRSEQTLQLATANISGDLFEMWAGPLSFAAGLEHRRYEGEYTPDPINYVTVTRPDGSTVVESHYNGVPSLPTSGEYDVNEAYVEFNVPLMRDGLFGKSLDLSLAGRYSDYSTFGGEFVPKYGLRWQVADELMLHRPARMVGLGHGCPPESHHGIADETIQFFILHIECDDGHAETLHDIMLEIAGANEFQLENMLKAGEELIQARLNFFSAIERQADTAVAQTNLNVAFS